VLRPTRDDVNPARVQPVEHHFDAQAEQNAYAILTEAYKRVLAGQPLEARDLIRLARERATPEQQDHIHYLSAAVTFENVHLIRDLRQTKGHPLARFARIHAWFEAHLCALVPGAVMLECWPLGSSRPDFLLDVAGEVRPVECARLINARAVQKMRGHLKRSAAAHGYLVGERVSVRLPACMTFIACPEGTARG
jgi:hypothetical protein